MATSARGRLAKLSKSFARLRVFRKAMFPCSSTPETAKEFLARSIPKRIMVDMDLLTLCLEGLGSSILAPRCRQSGEVHVIR